MLCAGFLSVKLWLQHTTFPPPLLRIRSQFPHKLDAIRTVHILKQPFDLRLLLIQVEHNRVFILILPNIRYRRARDPHRDFSRRDVVDCVVDLQFEVSEQGKLGLEVGGVFGVAHRLYT